jgi:hypothetical protein
MSFAARSRHLAAEAALTMDGLHTAVSEFQTYFSSVKRMLRFLGGADHFPVCFTQHGLGLRDIAAARPASKLPPTIRSYHRTPNL